MHESVLAGLLQKNDEFTFLIKPIIMMHIFSHENRWIIFSYYILHISIWHCMQPALVESHLFVIGICVNYPKQRMPQRPSLADTDMNASSIHKRLPLGELQLFACELQDIEVFYIVLKFAWAVAWLPLTLLIASMYNICWSPITWRE